MSKDIVKGTVCPRCGTMQFSVDVDIRKAISDAFYAGMAFGMDELRESMKNFDPINEEETSARAYKKIANLMTKHFITAEYVDYMKGDVVK